VIATIVPVTPSDMDQAPNLQCLAVMATGIGWVDKEDCAKRGITVVNTPQSNIPAVSEHCIGLYFAIRKRIVQMHNLTTTTDEWAEKGTLIKYWDPIGAPLSVQQEVLGIIGYGHLGKRIEMLAKALGFGEVMIAERKRIPPRAGRKIFQEVISKCTVLVIACPRDEMTVGLIGKEDLRSMQKHAILINMARGGIVNEQALADALRYGWIAGAATDVLDVEPGVLGESPLLPKKGEEPVPNFTISPHVSWFSVQTIEMLQKLLKEGIEGWYKGEVVEKNTVVHDGKIYR
jgi:phosphoglycerate dehydrogenase-like enzyme